jgi:hypothetical protein
MAKSKQVPVQEQVSLRLSDEELHRLMATARHEYSRVSEYGGDLVGMTLCLLLVDLLGTLKEQNRLLIESRQQ